MRRGLVVGKFYPVHAGHQFLIDTALAGSEQLTILVCDRPEYRIPASVRAGWLAELYPTKNVDIVIIQDELDDNDSKGWAKNTIDTLGFAPDIVFTSEDYGDTYAKYLGAHHIKVDKARKNFPISGTEIRNNPWGHWQYLSKPVREYFARRICVLGAESTGTTTLSKALAQHYSAEWVAEYGREYSEEKIARDPNEAWTSNEFAVIAQEQNNQEDSAARNSGGLVVCDTDAFATSVWHERYMDGRSPDVEHLALGRHYDLYILTGEEIPFVQDGTRDGEHIRSWMNDQFRYKLSLWGKPYLEVHGDKNTRLALATKCIDHLLEHGTLPDLPEVHRNAWSPKPNLTA